MDGQEYVRTPERSYIMCRATMPPLSRQIASQATLRGPGSASPIYDLQRPGFYYVHHHGCDEIDTAMRREQSLETRRRLRLLIIGEWVDLLTETNMRPGYQFEKPQRIWVGLSEMASDRKRRCRDAAKRPGVVANQSKQTRCRKLA